MSRFHALTVTDIERTTHDCSVITLDVPAEKSGDFNFKQGQYLTLKTTIDGEEVRRSYSLCSSPLDNKWSVAVKQIEGGLFSTFANQQLKVGDELEVMPPAGDFYVDVDPTQARNYIAFAAGSGITPILSTIKTHLSAEPESTFKLFYVNRAVSSIILKEELEALKNIFLDRLEIFHFLTREPRNAPLFNGRIDQVKLQLLFKTICPVERVDHCFVCGPKDMIFLVRDELKAAGLPAENIHYELFYSGDVDTSAAARVIENQAKGAAVIIIDGGKEFHLTMGEQHDNILDAALAAGADLPFACKGGVCSTCKCKVLAGSVEMKKNYALEPDEVAKNFVLSCQAVPTSDSVKLDFDV
ncbi:phenylacetic acid degradation protein [Lewinellaceae bacterium SD302]|nr:phenylacetic acid degradation protein [Lewinellaceae bacterium SD302]